MVHVRALVFPILAGLALVSLGACGAAADGTTIPTTGTPDAGMDARLVPAAFQSTVVLVNALTSDAIGDVRICPKDSKALAVPSNRPIALTNYPGLARGRGVDLGIFDLSGGVDVFSASAIKDKSGDCGTMRNTSTFTHLAITPASGPSALVLVDDAKGVITAKQIALTVGATPTSDEVAGQFAFAGTGLTATQLTMTFQTAKAQTGTSAASSGFLLPKSYGDKVHVSDDSATFTYDQTLASIQYVSDPTTDPVTFFDPRTQYLFILVGDPSEPYSAYKAPEQLTGRELHLAAVPFTLVPKGAP